MKYFYFHLKIYRSDSNFLVKRDVATAYNFAIKSSAPQGSALSLPAKHCEHVTNSTVFATFTSH